MVIDWKIYKELTMKEVQSMAHW